MVRSRNLQKVSNVALSMPDSSPVEEQSVGKYADNTKRQNLMAKRMATTLRVYAALL
jgi:hypothetical protein